MTPVAIITPVFPPYRGGIGVLAELDARQLSAAGYDVHVYSPGRSGHASGPFSLRHLESPLRYGNAAIVPSLRQIVKKYPLTVLHYPFYGGAEFVALGDRDHANKLVVTYHMDTVGRGLLGMIFRAHAKALMPAMLTNADRVLVTSTDYAKTSALSRIAGLEKRIRVMAPAVDTERFSPGPRPADLADRLNIGHADRTVLMVAGLDRAHYFKGVAVLLRALSTQMLDGVSAIIVGDGDLRPSYQALAKKLGIADRVRFVGAVAPAELSRYYRLADVFVFPSIDRSEAFGLAALEALSSGLPVVASELPGVRTIVRDGITGRLVVPGSVSSLAARLSELLNDREMRLSMGHAARTMVENEYTEAARLGRWREILAELHV